MTTSWRRCANSCAERVAACVRAGASRATASSSIRASASASGLSTISRCWRRLPALNDLRRPLLVGASRKSLFGALLGRPLDERLAGGLAVAAARCLPERASFEHMMWRETVDAVKIATALQRCRAIERCIIRVRYEPREKHAWPRNTSAPTACGATSVNIRMTVDFALRLASSAARVLAPQRRHGAGRQGHPAVRLHVRGRAGGGLRRFGRQRHADRTVADARDRLSHDAVRVRLRRRDQRVAQSLRGQRHQVLRRERRQACPTRSKRRSSSISMSRRSRASSGELGQRHARRQDRACATRNSACRPCPGST